MKLVRSANTTNRTSNSRHFILSNSLLIYKISLGKEQVVSFLTAFYLLKIVVKVLLELLKLVVFHE